MIKNIDYLIIGAGPAGISAATILSKTDKKVLIVAKQLGGVYCNEGSIVSNSLLYFSQLYDKYLQVQNNFMDLDKEYFVPKLDFKRLKRYIDNNVNRVKRMLNDTVEKLNIEYLDGTAKFIGTHTVEVISPDDSINTINFKKAIIAVGSEQQKFMSSFKCLDISGIARLETIPTTISIIGGGFIGVEIATFFHRLGSKVTIIEKETSILPTLDQQIVKKYDEILVKKGITIITGHQVEKIDKVGQKYLILFDDMQVESEQVFLSIGRVPSISPLNLEMADVTVTDGVPLFDLNLATSNKDIYLAGDVTATNMQSSWAFFSGQIVAKNILGEDILSDQYNFMVYLSTDPETGFIGLSEEEAKMMSYDYDTVKINCNNFFKHLLSADSVTTIKIIYNKTDLSFIGVHVLGKGGRELLSAFYTFMQAGVKIDQISKFIGIRSVYSEIFTEIANKIKQ